MTKLDKYKIEGTSTIMDALAKIDSLSAELTLTLFVIDTEGRVIGSVTDGDIRRGVLRGVGLDDCVQQVMSADFIYLDENRFDLNTLKRIKANRTKLVPVLDTGHRLLRVINFNENRSLLPVDAVLMAGGKGERLRPMTLTTPKPLLEVGGRPIIDYNIDNLIRNGIEHIHVTINYLGEQIETHFAEPRNGIQVHCVREPNYLGTMGSIKFIEQWHNDTVLVLNSDLFTNIDLEEFFLHFKEHDADMSIAAVPYSVNVPYGIFEIDGRRDIRGIKEKPSFHYYANAGIYLLRREVLDLIPDQEFFNATDLIHLLIGRGKSVVRFPLSGYWIDIGKPEDFKKVQDLAQHLQKK
jgi:dTDP-glucose pyrophosphorylase